MKPVWTRTAPRATSRTRAATPSGPNPSIVQPSPGVTRSAARPKLQIAKPRVFIPSFPGTNCELDSEKAFRRAGAETDVFVFRNLTAKGIEESVEALAEEKKIARLTALDMGRP